MLSLLTWALFEALGKRIVQNSVVRCLLRAIIKYIELRLSTGEAHRVRDINGQY